MKNVTPGQVLFVIFFALFGIYLGLSIATPKQSSDARKQEQGRYESTVSNSSSNTSSTSSTESSETQTTCSICGRKFSGAGYEEVSEGRWEPTKYPHMSSICSVSCGMKHTNEMNALIDKADESTGLKCSHCGFGHYVNGYCNYCGAASQTTVNRSQENYPVCTLCHGTGIEMPMGANSAGETGRICPMCNGTGHQNY